LDRKARTVADSTHRAGLWPTSGCSGKPLKSRSTRATIQSDITDNGMAGAHRKPP
jgi:hypothetical protein